MVKKASLEDVFKKKRGKKLCTLINVALSHRKVTVNSDVKGNVSLCLVVNNIRAGSLAQTLGAYCSTLSSRASE